MINKTLRMSIWIFLCICELNSNFVTSLADIYSWAYKIYIENYQIKKNTFLLKYWYKDIN